jgi:hypothetical protein
MHAETHKLSIYFRRRAISVPAIWCDKTRQRRVDPPVVLCHNCAYYHHQGVLHTSPGLASLSSSAPRGARIYFSAAELAIKSGVIGLNFDAIPSLIKSRLDRARG